MVTSQPSTTDTVRSIVGRQLNFAAHGHRFGSDDDLWGLGMTSVTCLGLMLTIEDAFGVELPEEALKESTFRSVSAIVAAVDGVRRQRRESPAAEEVSLQI